MKRKLCKRCGRQPACIRFCNNCAREIQAAHNNVMNRAVAARAFINSTRGGATSEYLRQLEIVAAISIFNPEIPIDKAIQIARGK